MAKKALILYYSQTDETAKLAAKIHQLTGADILRIRVAPGTFPPGQTAIDKAYRQQRASGSLPTLTTKLPEINFYDVILLGGPVWDGQISSPVMATLNHLQGYRGTVAPFSTGWNDTGNYQQDFRAHAGKLYVVAGYHVLIHGKPQFSLPGVASWLRKL